MRTNPQLIDHDGLRLIMAATFRITSGVVKKSPKPTG